MKYNKINHIKILFKNVDILVINLLKINPFPENYTQLHEFLNKIYNQKDMLYVSGHSTRFI